MQLVLLMLPNEYHPFNAPNLYLNPSSTNLATYKERPLVGYKHY